MSSSRSSSKRTPREFLCPSSLGPDSARDESLPRVKECLSGQSQESLIAASSSSSWAHQLFDQMLSIQKSIDEIKNSTLTGASSDPILSVQKSIEDMRSSQDVRDQSLQGFIHRELQVLKESLAYEVQSRKDADASLSSPADVQVILESQDRRLEEILNKFSEAIQKADKTEAMQLANKSETNGCIDMYISHGLSQASLDVESPELKRPSVVTTEQWEVLQQENAEVDQYCIYKGVVQRSMSKRSFWHDVFESLGCLGMVDKEIPNTCVARATVHPTFSALQTFLILINTCIMGYESDVSIRAALQEPRGKVPSWLSTCNLIFNIIFAVEVGFRMIALRSWFWVAPSEWGWNIFDVCLVTVSLLSDVFSSVANLSFIRTFRILRAIRVARIIRVLRFFRHLRKMLFAILSCVGSLLWCFVFLAMTIFMFSILFLQGSVAALHDAEDTSEHAELFLLTDEWFGSLPASMFTCLAAVTGGTDWLEVRKPLARAGWFYSTAFVVYTLFVIVGVMNVLTGVFLSCAEDMKDNDLIVQTEQIRVERFCSQMLELFNELDLKHTGEVDWPTFHQAMQSTHIQAFLASHQLEPTHMRLTFDLLDEQGAGRIDLMDFVMGMVRLKGEAKAIDARILQREMALIPEMLEKAMLARRRQIS